MPPAVGDHRAAADDRLEHGQAGGRVHERVGRRQPVAHAIGEADGAQAALAREARREARAHVLAAPAQADHGRAPDAQRDLGRALEVADAPSRRPRRRRPGRRPAGRARGARPRVARQRGSPARSCRWPTRSGSRGRWPAPPRSTRGGSRDAGRRPGAPSSAGPARSVMAEATGTSRRPCWRRRPSASLTPG